MLMEVAQERNHPWIVRGNYFIEPYLLDLTRMGWVSTFRPG